MMQKIVPVKPAEQYSATFKIATREALALVCVFMG